MSDNLQVRIVSATGDVVALVTSETEKGKILKADINYSKIGGLNDFSFTLDRKTDIPLFNEMECQFYVNGSLWFTGYTDIIPTPETDKEFLEVTGFGYFNKLKLKTLNQSYTSTTIGAILASLNFSDLEINYNAGKINAPAVAISSIEFKDKSYKEVIDSLLSIANYDYQTTQYVYGVDEEKDFYFKPLDSGLKKKLFEGYNFQKPETEKVVNVTNEILAYRTIFGDSKNVEYVATYQDLFSQERNGLFTRKIVFPDYADTATIANIANQILEKNKDPKTRISFKDYALTEKLEDGFYGIAVKPEEYWTLLNECDTLEGWNLTNAVVTTVTVSQEKVLTGKSAFKCVTASGSAGEYIEYILPKKITSPKIVRAYFYFLSQVADIKIDFIDSQDSTVPVQLTTGVDQWLKYQQFIGALITQGNYDIDIGAGPDVYTIDIGSGVENYEFRTGQDNLLIDIVKVRITFLTDEVRTIYVDRLEALAYTWAYNQLELEKVNYSLKQDFILASPDFGEEVSSLLDSIEKKVEDGNIAFNIYSKQ